VRVAHARAAGLQIHDNRETRASNRQLIEKARIAILLGAPRRGAVDSIVMIIVTENEPILRHLDCFHEPHCAGKCNQPA
jgi:hypothetical protein